MRVERRMRRKVIAIQKDETVERAQTLMAINGIRHLPVLDGRKLVGVLSDSDIRALMSPQRACSAGVRRREVFYLPAGVRAEEAMTADPVFVPPGTDIEDAARLLITRKIGCLPVVDRGRLVGIFTETDILWVFMEIMGILASSSRLDVALGRTPRAMERATEVIHRLHGEIISVGMSPGRRGAARVHHFRLKTCDTEPIAAALRKVGFRVLDRMG
jgi:acetoin utilization protein AcuB